MTGMTKKRAIIYVLDNSKTLRDWYRDEHDFSIERVENIPGEDGGFGTDSYEPGNDGGSMALAELGDLVIQEGIDKGVITGDDDECSWYPMVS